MRRLPLILALLAGFFARNIPAEAKAFFRIGPYPLPPAEKTGIEDLVLLWPVTDSSLVAELRARGYQVWLQCEAADLARAASAATALQAKGIIVTAAAAAKPSQEVQALRSSVEANLDVRFLVPGGKQPQLKGRLVVERDGVLQVSSPSTQPWLDTNLALVRLAEANGDPVPVLYDFRWDTVEVPYGAWHPDAEDYALAIAESDAVRSDVILDLPAPMQKGLGTGDEQAWALWKRVVPYLGFSTRRGAEELRPVASLGVVVDDARASYEAVNLMTRHNLAFEVVRPSGVNPEKLGRWNSVAVFCSLKPEAAQTLRDFAARGGIVVFVNSHDPFPWHATAPLRREFHTATWTVGSGQIVEMGEPVVDPERFARDLRRLLGRERSPIALWNSLTTLVTAFRSQQGRETTLYLVNYADQPENVQVQVRGRFKTVRLEAPGEPCCALLPFVVRKGFTEFTIPSLGVAARVHLESDEESTASQ